MSISFGPFMAGFLAILFLTLYIYILLNHTKGRLLGGLKWLFICMSIIMIRMLIPVNFPFSITLYDTKLLPHIGNVIYTRINGVMLFTIAIVIWIIVMTILLGRLIYKTVQLNKSASLFIDKNFCLADYLVKNSNNPKIKKINVAIVPEYIAPMLIGIFHPILILPQYCINFNNIEDIVCHEVEHYLNYDLYLKLLLELLTCVYWWNPIMYILRKQFFLSIEISNDDSVIRDKSDEARIKYANCIVNVMKHTQSKTSLKSNLALPFIDCTNKHFVKRMERILYSNVNYDNKILLFLNCLLLLIIAIMGFVFVPEALSSEPNDTGVFDVTPDNSYFIHSENGYSLYVDSKYMFTFQEIPDEFKNIELRR